MSHFVTAIIANSTKEHLIKAILAPYNANDYVEEELCKTKEELIKELTSEESIIERYGKVNENNFEEIAESWYGEDIHFDSDGNMYTMSNPNAKWDWWHVGGRWHGAFQNKAGEPCDYMKVKDFDYSVDKERYDKAMRFWEIIVEDAPLKDGEEKPFNLYKKEYYLERYKTKENYAEEVSIPLPFALIYDGKWYEQGEMGWFGVSSDTLESAKDFRSIFEEVVLSEKNQDKYIIFIDCHI